MDTHEPPKLPSECENVLIKQSVISENPNSTKDVMKVPLNIDVKKTNDDVSVKSGNIKIKKHSKLPNEVNNNDDTIDVYPDGGLQAWLVCAGVAIVSFVCWGTNLSLSVYVQHYIVYDKNFSNISRAAASFIASASTSLTFLTSLPSNYIEDKFGIRNTLSLGLLIVSLGLLLVSFTSNFYLIVIFQAVVCGIGRGFLSTPISHIMSRWFSKKIIIAMGIAHFGSGIGGMFYSYFINYLLKTKGLVYSYHYVNLLSICTCIPGIYFVKSRIPTVSLSTGLPVQKTMHTGFLSKNVLFSSLSIILLTRAFFSQWGYVTVRSIIPTYYSEAIQNDRDAGSSLMVYFSLGISVGRLVASCVFSMIGITLSAIILELISVLFALAVWIPSSSFIPNAINSFVQGTTAGTILLTALPISTLFTPPIGVRSIMAFVWIVSSVASLISLTSALYIVDILVSYGYNVKTSYRVAICFNSFLFIISICLSILTHIKIKRRQALGKRY